MLSDLNAYRRAQKVVQYALKLALLFHASATAVRLVRHPQAGRWEHDVLRRLDSAASKLSLSRCVRALPARLPAERVPGNA
jgi:hypothetical protein